MDCATFSESWNSIIPHKIKAAELEHPTESFVFRCAISFFRMMKYDFTEFENMYNESKETLMQKRVNLVAQINYFYHLCGGSKQSNFFYVDLIKPSPKKTFHVLNILLNFLFYVNMMRDETVERATACTAKYQELSAKINQQQREHEHLKIKHLNIEQNICKMQDQLPQLEHENEKIRAKTSKLQTKIATIKAADEDFVEKITKLKMDYTTLQEQRIDDEDAAALIQKNEELEAEILECEKQEKTLQLSNSEYTTRISQIKPCILLAEEILQNPQDDSLRTIKTEVDNLMLNFSKLEKDYANKANILNALQKNCESIREYLEEKEKDLKAKQRTKRKTERKTMSDLGAKQIQLDELKEQNDSYTEQLTVLKEEILLILRIADQTMKFLNRDPVKITQS